MELFTICLTLITTLLLSINWLYSRKRNYWRDRNIPEVPQISLPTLVYYFLTWKNHLVHTDMNNYRKLSGHKFGGLFEIMQPVLLVRDPDLLRNVMVKDFHHFVDRRGFKSVEKDPVVGRMLTTQTGETWKEARSILSPTFSSGKLKGMMPIFFECGNHLLEYCESKTADTGEAVFEATDVFERFAMDAIASTAFGVQSNSFGSERSDFLKFGKTFQKMKTLMLLKIVTVMMLPFTARFLKLSFFAGEAEEFYRGAIRSAIEIRKKEDFRRNDFLQLILDAGNTHHDKSDAKGLFSEDGIMAHALLFILAGFDTLASLLSMAAYEMALNPDVQERMYEEIQEVKEKHGGKINYDAIQEMEYVDMAMQETLRKYPPSAKTERMCTEDYKIPGTDITIEKGMLVQIPIYPLHHDEEYYPDPEKFDPERFSSEEKAARNPYVYLPFGHGPRNCIGLRFALLEAKVALVSLLDQFKISTCSKTQIPIVFDRMAGLLKGKGGIWLTMTKRT